jgi:lysyl-tRNA synthetase class 2
MYRIPVASSNLESVGYENGILEIRFKHGGTYQYLNVPEYLYQGLMSAASKGTYFDQHIKKAGFPCRKVSL